VLLFLVKILANFGPEKYDFDLYKGFFMEKFKKICQIYIIIIIFRLPDFYEKFQ
jgi:hypothetical protein